ncbi:hypothetical protein [Amphibiibacter pelophylacis]|uniref:Uncharacterized protein n=1 Tax=Amphibiibacter pelophylacis TaxID=1799477 RepID=A0ACC6P4Q4_9BURK
MALSVPVIEAVQGVAQMAGVVQDTRSDRVSLNVSLGSSTYRGDTGLSSTLAAGSTNATARAPRRSRPTPAI